VLPVLSYQLAHDGPIERAVTTVAAWARWCEGTDEHGARFDIVDPAADTLRARAAAQLENPLAFVENREIFGDLAANSRFVETFTRALASLAADGARATLAALTLR
jgi:mannitol 2-dehydrogenase